MRCEESRPLIDFYLDGELDALRAAEFELHVSNCEACTPQIERASKLRAAIRESAGGHEFSIIVSFTGCCASAAADSAPIHAAGIIR